MSAPKTAKERAALIKKQQEDALAALPLNALSIVLWIRSDPPRPNDFHWGYYFHTSSQGGIKYHMRNIGGGWMPDHGPTGGVFKSNFLCVLIQVGTIPEAARNALDQTMRSHDGDVNTIPGVTSRVWVLTIFRRLMQYGIVRCSDIGGLERECMTLGNQYSPGAAINQQPRPVVRSSLCL